MQGYASANRIRLTTHARQRMIVRRTAYAELRAVLMTAPTCTIQSNGRVRVDGVDADGDALEVIVVIENGVLVVTLFG